MNHRSISLPKSACVPFLGRVIAMAVCCLMFSSEIVFSQDEQAEIERRRKLYQSIEWQRGPCTASVAGVAQITVPAGYQFTGPEGAAIWGRITENPPSGTAGIFVPVDSPDSWFLSFHFDELGYVPDDEKTQLDADAILKGIRANTEAENEIRRKNGWSELHVGG